jgi:hypothetical protein
MATRLARRSRGKFAKRPGTRSAAIRRVGGSIARKAVSHAAGAVRRIRSDTQVKALTYGAIGAVGGAVIEAKVPQLPAVQGVPAQLLIGAVTVGAGFLLKGKTAEALLYGGMGPLFAGVSTIARRIASDGTLAGEFDGGPFGFGPTAIAGEYDDVVSR